MAHYLNLLGPLAAQRAQYLFAHSFLLRALALHVLPFLLGINLPTTAYRPFLPNPPTRLTLHLDLLTE